MSTRCAALGALVGGFIGLSLAAESFVATSAQADTAHPFFMFTTSKFASDAERTAISNALTQYVTSSDYLSVRLGEEFPQLAERAGRSHLYALPPNLRSVERMSSERCDSGSPGLIIYDGEHWSDTPPDEQADMPAAIARGKDLAKASRCHAFGIAPDGEFIGLDPQTCSYDVGKGIHRRIDWDDIALFNIQAQRLLSDACSSRAGVDAYVRFVTGVAREVRDKNSTTKISAQFSFRYTPPDRMIAAAERLRAVVDGFYIAYPSNVGPPCAYCSPQNLASVLRAIKS